MNSSSLKLKVLTPCKVKMQYGLTLTTTVMQCPHHPYTTNTLLGYAKIQGLRQASQGGGGRFCPLLYRPVPLHLLLGAKGAGGCKGTWNPVQSHPHHRERDGTKCARTGHNIRIVPGWEVCDPEHPVGQEIFEIGRRSGLNNSGIFLIFQ